MQNIDVVLDPLRGLMLQVGAYLPRLAIAVLVVVGGWLLAKALRFSVVKALRAVNAHVLTERAGLDAFLEQGGTRHDTVDLVGALAYAVVLIAALFVAFNSLGLTQVTDLLGRVLLYVPRLLVALGILVFGAYFARFVGRVVRGWLRGAGASDAEVMGRVVHYGIVAFVVLLAIDHLEIGSGLIQTTFLILLAGTVLALAIAFGLGGRDRAAALLERWFPRAPSDRGGR